MAHALELIFKISLLIFMVGNLGGMGLELAARDALRPLRDARFVAHVLAWGFVLGPAIAWGLARVLPMDPGFGVGLILLGLVPCAPFLPMVVRKAGGSLPHAAAMILLTVVGTVAVMPVAVPLLIDGLPADAWTIGRPLLLFVLAPLLLGLAIRAKAPGAAAVAAPIVRKGTLLGTIVLLVSMAIIHRAELVSVFGSLAIVAQLLLLGAVGLGSHLVALRFPHEQRSVLTLGHCTRNLGAGLAPLMAVSQPDPKAILMLVLAVPTTVLLSAGIALVYLRGRRPSMPSPRISGLLLVAGLLAVRPDRTVTAATIRVPADQPTIQLAVDNASAGDTIAVAAGNYAELTTVSGRRALTIQGAGWTNTSIITPGVGPAFSLQNCDDITITGFHLESVGIAGDSSNAAIWVNESINITVHHCYITRQAGNGVLINGNSGLHAYSNIMVKIGDDAVSFRGGSGTGLVHDNTFADNGTNSGLGVGGSGIGLYTSGTVRCVSFNNISWGNDYGLAQDGSSTIDHDYDLVGANVVTNYYNMSATPNDLGCDPLFVNAALGDYHIQSASCAIDQGTSAYGGNPNAATDIDDAPKPGGAAPEIGADEVGCMTSFAGWQDLFRICEGDTVTLNALTLDLPECPSTPSRVWTDDGSAPAMRDVTPSVDTTYEVTVTCPSDPDCVIVRTVTVDVDLRPKPFVATAQDYAPCNEGILVSWARAIFLGPGGTGTYRVLRSTASCSDAQLQPAIATGLTDTQWIDTTVEPGVPYFYAVQAEDDSVGSACLPPGPNNGGATTIACIVSPAVDGVDLTPPADPGAAVLRARHVGQQVTMLWPTSRALLADEHFHLVKQWGRPIGTWTRANPEGDLSLSFTETDTTHWLQCFLIRVANACETESADRAGP